MKRATRMIEGTHATSALKVVEALTAINEAKITTATKLANAARATKRLEAEAAEAEAAEAEAAAANRITSADKVEDLRSVGQILEECLVGRGRASEGKNAEWYAFYEATMQEVTFEEYRRKIADILPRYWPAPKGGHGETAHDNWFHNMVFLCCQWGSQNVYFH
ncbi:hypothetical protein F5884DRAFT_813814 [Xylogone sp. PMI_703]|nr:hypothetical protein F5884DRAFT_813814 [Xylogone sp. PMI_703]